MISEDQEILALDDKAILDRNGRTMVLIPAGEGERPTPLQVQVRDLGDGRYQILNELAAGDTVVIPITTQTGAEKTKDSNPLSMLGFPSGGPGMGRPPGSGGGGSR